MRIAAPDSALLLIDLQERLKPVIHDHERILLNCGKLLQAARRLKIPLAVTEHCPEAIGYSLPQLREHLAAEEIYCKRHFGAADEMPFRERISNLGRQQWILCGVEAHVCLLQTALGLRRMEKDVFIVADATGSRKDENRLMALERLRGAGCIVVTTEMVLFEWLEHADNPAFKEVLRLIK